MILKLKEEWLKMNNNRILLTTLISLFAAGIVYGQTGMISGTVKFTGTPPHMQPFKVTFNNNVCGTEKSLQRLVLGKDGSVANAIVYVEGLKGKAERVSPSEYVIDQNDCSYTPHVLIVGHGNAFTVVNSDAVFHNIHGYYSSSHKTAFNLAEPVKGMKLIQKVKAPGIYLLRCDVHPWMNAYVFVTGNGYAAETNKAGEYIISGVPAGKYKVVMWHEGWGVKMVNGIPQFSRPVKEIRQVTVMDGKTATVDFTLK